MPQSPTVQMVQIVSIHLSSTHKESHRHWTSLATLAGGKAITATKKERSILNWRIRLSVPTAVETITWLIGATLNDVMTERTRNVPNWPKRERRNMAKGRSTPQARTSLVSSPQVYATTPGVLPTGSRTVEQPSICRTRRDGCKNIACSRRIMERQRDWIIELPSKRIWRRTHLYDGAKKRILLL